MWTGDWRASSGTGSILRHRAGLMDYLSLSPLRSCRGSTCGGPLPAWRALTGRPMASTLDIDETEERMLWKALQSPFPRIVTWNARALFACDPAKFKDKVATVRSLLGSCDILTVQETHGDGS
eukprot:1898102-Amphidinium_carterae.2